MSFSLAAVLRVRKIQQDQAAAAVGAAQHGARLARSEHARREALLDGRPDPGSAVAAQWLATCAGNLAMAADAHYARLASMTADEEIAAALDSWSRAKMAHEGIERLEVRYEDGVRRDAEAAEQRAADDRTGAAHHARGLAVVVDGVEQ